MKGTNNPSKQRSTSAAWVNDDISPCSTARRYLGLDDKRMPNHSQKTLHGSVSLRKTPTVVSLQWQYEQLKALETLMEQVSGYLESQRSGPFW